MAGKDEPKTARAGEPLDLSTSVAGEEDPGASIDMAQGSAGAKPSTPTPMEAAAQANGAMAPGDEAPAGTPSTGEDVCPECGGTGRLGASACPNCQGTGKVIVGIGGA